MSSPISFTIPSKSRIERLLEMEPSPSINVAFLIKTGGADGTALGLRRFASAVETGFALIVAHCASPACNAANR